ncbi:MAG: hypothetical protein VYC34_07830, partial [Planctomycetota bacterium]|nr:hypothetical protein [Planctomycetota bacterium]
VAGAKLELVTLETLWLPAAIVIFVRAAMIWLATWLGLRGSRLGPQTQRWLWTAFLPQAGVSVLLATIIQQTFSDFTFAQTVYSLLLAVIAVEELLSPIILKITLAKAEPEGETGIGPAGPDASDSQSPGTAPGPEGA